MWRLRYWNTNYLNKKIANEVQRKNVSLALSRSFSEGFKGIFHKIVKLYFSVKQYNYFKNKCINPLILFTSCSYNNSSFFTFKTATDVEVYQCQPIE